MKGAGKRQLSALIKSRIFLNKYRIKKFDPFKDNFFYLASYINSIGHIKLKSFLGQKENFISKFYIFIKDILYGSYYLNGFLYKKKKVYNYEKIIISWANKSSFDKFGIYKDKFYNINSNYKKKKILWFLIYSDKHLPDKVNNNIIIYHTIKRKKFVFFFFLKFLFLKIKYIFCDLDLFFNSISSHNLFSEIVLKSLKPLLNSKLKNVEIPYEGQPFQNEIIRYVKNYKPNVNIRGYIHAAPLPLPANLVNKYYTPDNIIVNGIDQKKCFTSLLGWDKKKIIVKPSCRFLIKNFPKKNHIYLPANIRKPNIIIDSIKFLSEKNYIDLIKFKIKKHPAASNSDYTKYIIKKIENLYLNAKKKKIIEKNYQSILIFVGVTGGIIEALEKNLKVLHIVEDHFLDLYTKEIWPNIICRKIFKNIYTYNIKNKGHMIKFGNNKTKYF